MYDHTFWAKGGGPIVFAGMSAIEQSLSDIKGKALGVPAYELLGGKVRDSVRVYANGWSFRCVTPDDFARAAERVGADRARLGRAGEGVLSRMFGVGLATDTR